MSKPSHASNNLLNVAMTQTERSPSPPKQSKRQRSTSHFFPPFISPPIVNPPINLCHTAEC